MDIKTYTAKNRLVTTLLLGLSFVFTLPAYADSGLWQDINPDVIKSTKAKHQASKSSYQNARFLDLNIKKMSAYLNQNNQRVKSLKSLSSKQQNPLKIDLPLPDGRVISVSIIKSNILPVSLSNKYPEIKTFKVLPDDEVVSGKLDMTINGFHAILQTHKGETLFIDPIGGSVYASYAKHDQKKSEGDGFSCSTHSRENLFDRALRSSTTKTTERSSKSLLNYRIAIAATGEYTAKHGGTVAGALSAISTTINRVNQVFEQDLGIHLSLVENNDELIYVDASSDPYMATDSKELLYQNQINIDSIIGSENYDIGHLFSASGGGLAAIGSTCNNNRKAQGVSGISNPQNDSFNLDFVAHEIGHQFGATHTFNGVEGLCAGETRSANTAFEPGSGSTVMSYAGYCGQDNLQTNTDAMFHIGSIQQIRSYISEGENNGCGIPNIIKNEFPKVEAGIDYVIPAQTPFELKGGATDAEGDALIYAWQQVDVGELSPVNSDRGDNALFRVHPLTAKKSRMFPPLKNILNHTSQAGEVLPIQQRLMKFKLVVQDSFNTTQSDEMSVLVQRTGSRFALNMPRSQYQLGESYKILWNVAGTNQNPINCNSVDISLSVDGGHNFAQVLGEGLPNTGMAWVTIPSSSRSTSQGRFKISCSDNIFFAVSYRNFYVNSQNHKTRLKFADEDQPELKLKDVDLNKVNDTKYDELVQVKQGGGSLDWFMLILLMSVFKRFKKAKFY